MTTYIIIIIIAIIIIIYCCNNDKMLQMHVIPSIKWPCCGMPVYCGHSVHASSLTLTRAGLFWLSGAQISF